MGFFWTNRHNSSHYPPPLGPAESPRIFYAPSPLPSPLYFPAPSPVFSPAPAPFNFTPNETDVTPELPVNEEEVFASLSILLHIFLLGIAFVVGHILRRRKFYYLHEASAALLIGLFAGIYANFATTEDRFRKWLNFREEFFLLFLLPPIIFQSGFSLQPKPFFSNFGAICTFALLGTFIAAVVTGILTYIAGVLFLIYRLSFLESLAFGAVISATDPVTVLAIFQELGADTNLYALVFGESVLNDAVAIVMYRTLKSVISHPDGHMTFFASVRYAGITFVGSLSIGVVVALSCALLFKYARLSVRNLHNLECCLIVLFPYISYMVAEGYALSGIVAILFCGILMKHYTFPNLSEMAQVLSAGFFQLIASLAETFTFIYMGVEIALGEQQSWSHFSFIFFSIIFIFVARFANIVPCTMLVNWFRPPSKRIPRTHQKALLASGLRGAMAFALALQSVHDLPEGHGNAIYTSTTAIVMLTVLVIGGSTATLLERLGVAGERLIRHNGGGNYSEEERRPLSSQLEDSHDDDEDRAGQSTPQDMLQRRLRLLQESAPTFSSIDSKYIRPFFTAQSEDDLSTFFNGGREVEMGAVSSPPVADTSRFSRQPNSGTNGGFEEPLAKQRSKSDPALGSGEQAPSSPRQTRDSNDGPRSGLADSSDFPSNRSMSLPLIVPRLPSLEDPSRQPSQQPSVTSWRPVGRNDFQIRRQTPHAPLPPGDRNRGISSFDFHGKEAQP